MRPGLSRRRNDGCHVPFSRKNLTKRTLLCWVSLDVHIPQNLLFKPAGRVAWIVNRLCNRRVFERKERIYHYREFLGTVSAKAFLDRARMWAMWDATRVQGDR